MDPKLGRVIRVWSRVHFYLTDIQNLSNTTRNIVMGDGPQTDHQLLQIENKKYSKFVQKISAFRILILELLRIISCIIII